MTVFDDQNAKSIRDMMDVVVEVKATINGTVQTFTYTNDDLLSVELNLRSDLSPIDPTLPESEIVVKVYEEQDVSSIVKLIADNQPLTYKAGYNGTYCTVRSFYISEPVTWADKVLTFKAVDAVHFLNQDATAIWDAAYYASNSGRTAIGFNKNGSGQDITSAGALGGLNSMFNYLVRRSGKTVTRDHTSGAGTLGGQAVNNADAFVFVPEGNVRENIANMMNLVRLDFPSGAFNVTALYLTYVDAGIPTFMIKKPTSKWTINEADCGDIKRETARDIVKIIPQNKTLLLQDFKRANLTNNPKIGSVTISKDSGASVSLDTYGMVGNAKMTGYSNWVTMIALGSIQYSMKALPDDDPYYNGGFMAFKDGGFMPWDSSLQTFWNTAVTNGVIANDATEANFDIFGGAIISDNADDQYTKTGSGETANPTKTKWVGKVCVKGQDNTVYELLPKMGFEQLLNRSNETGSFTWKGDPRMQPRDVFTFTKLDGTTELRTVESINLKHEGGGTIAKITYRKGIV